MLKSRAQMRMSEFILDISISPFPHPHCAPFLGAFSMCKDSLRKHQVWFLLPDAPVEKYLSTISTKVLGFTHWPGWSHMLMVQPGVWSTLVSLVLKLGGGTTHTNPMDWDRENNQLPEGISENGNWMRTGRNNVCYIITPYIYHYITPHLLIQEKTFLLCSRHRRFFLC